MSGDPLGRIMDGMMPKKPPRNCPHAMQLLLEDQKAIEMGMRPEQATSSQIRTECPNCGSKKVRIGCPYQDCEKCQDIESSQCIDCRYGWGGAMYWK